MKTVKKMGMGGMSDGSMMTNSMMKKGGAVKAKSKKPKMAIGGSISKAKMGEAVKGKKK